MVFPIPGIQFKVSGILLTTKIQQRKDWNQVSGIWNPWRGVQSPRLSWIPLHEAQWLINNKSSWPLKLEEKWRAQCRIIILSLVSSFLCFIWSLKSYLIFRCTTSGIYADGPGAYLFHGVVEQQYIFHVMDHALCLSDSKQETCDKHVRRGGPVKSDSSKTQVLNTKCLILTFALVSMCC